MYAMKRQLQVNKDAAMLTTAQFLHDEVAIRYAKRINDVYDMPFNLAEQPQVKRLIASFYAAFRQVNCCSHGIDTATLCAGAFNGVTWQTATSGIVLINHCSIVPFPNTSCCCSFNRGPSATSQSFRTSHDCITNS